MLIVPYPPKVWLVKMLERRGRFLDPLAHAQLSERSACVVQGAMQDLLDCTHALGVQALFSLHRTKMHERITDKLLLIRRHQGSIQYWPARACGRRGSYGDLVRFWYRFGLGRDDAVHELREHVAEGKAPARSCVKVHSARRSSPVLNDARPVCPARAAAAAKVAGEVHQRAGSIMHR